MTAPRPDQLRAALPGSLRLGAHGGLALDEAFQTYIHERARFKLGKFAFRIQSLDIHLKGAPLPNGEARVACRIAVDLGRGGPLAIERWAREAREAFDHCMGVTERELRRTLQKFRHRKG